MLDEILPPEAVVVEAFGHDANGALFSEEARALGPVADRRRREFAVGRRCARGGLSALGAPLGPILPGRHREPLWPQGVVGSITHCEGYCAAAVALTSSIRALGIDAEPHDALPHGVLRHIALSRELAWVRAHGNDGMHRGRLLFSAKESVFKAWFSIRRRWLGFDHVLLRFDASTSTFNADLLGTHCGPPQGFEGRYLVRSGLVLTAIAVTDAAADGRHGTSAGPSE
jgi:4'-phosphopantetheinyl transferase EntD